MEVSGNVLAPIALPLTRVLVYIEQEDKWDPKQVQTL